MKEYRLKHIPSGLYYQPFKRGSNLGYNGKVYKTEFNALNFDSSDTLLVKVREDSIYYKSVIDSINRSLGYKHYFVGVKHFIDFNKNDFKIEEL